MSYPVVATWLVTHGFYLSLESMYIGYLINTLVFSGRAEKEKKIVCSPTLSISTEAHCPLERVVGTSKFQITKPDALFVVFLGIKWAYDFKKKIDHEFMGNFGPVILPKFGPKTKKPRPLFNANIPQKWWITCLFHAFITFGWVLSQFLKFGSFGAVLGPNLGEITGPKLPMNS